MTHRDLCEIAAEVRSFRWGKYLPAGKRADRSGRDRSPDNIASWCLTRLATIKGLTEVVGLDSGEELVALFLQNCGAWRSSNQTSSVRTAENKRIGEIKRELFSMLSPRIIKKFWPDLKQRKTLEEMYGPPLPTSDDEVKKAGE